MDALRFCYLAAGVFFLVGLLTGIWKYSSILESKDAVAREYINILHRASLMYSFASLLMAKFVELSSFSEQINFYAALSSISFFTFAQVTYFIHAILRDTDNQFRKPYKLGNWNLPALMIHGSMVFLILGEIGGFLVLFFGFLRTI